MNSKILLPGVVAGLLLLGLPGFAQQNSTAVPSAPSAITVPSGTSDSPGGAVAAKGTPTSAPAGTERIPAILPPGDPNLIFVEGESAVSTNFAREPILNYDCSGYRTLQLNKTTALKGDGEYFADFAFYVESTGTYELWYGGTPPANKDEAQVSYASPFSLVLDKISTFEIFRDTVHVVENYTPAYYWNLVGDFPLQSGSHRLRFQVTKPRNYDGKYFFYLDNFFLVKKENGTRLPVTLKPAVFPRDMDNRSIDRSFYSIDEYEKRIRDNPTDVTAALELSMVYSLIGDYYNALKYLRRADLLEPQDRTILLLLAKNTLWKGDTAGALGLYKNLLNYYGDDKGIWLEAGKVAAWTGRYTDSVAFFTDALKKFPQDLSLIVNRGLSELWSGATVRAKKDFETALALTGKDVGKLKNLGSIYTVNGYADMAVPVYKDALNLAPGDVELYTLLYDTYVRLNLTKEAQAVKDGMEKRFIPTPELTNFLDVFNQKIQLKNLVLDDYKKQLEAESDNLELRKLIAETDFWNGDMDGGIKEYESILANYIYRQLRTMEKASAEYMGILDRSLVYSRYLLDLPQLTASYAKRLNDHLGAIKKAQADLAQKKTANADTVKKGKEADLAGENALNEKITQSQSELAATINEISFLSATVQTLSDRFTSDRDRLQVLAQEDAKQEETFKNLTKDTHWTWDRGAMEKELEKARQNGTNLAAYALGRIALFQGDAPGAQRNFSALAKEKARLTGTDYGLVEAQLLRGPLPTVDALQKVLSDTEEPFASLGSDFLAYLGIVQEKPATTPGFLTDDPVVAINGALKELASLRDASFKQKTVVDKNTQEIYQLLSRSLQRNFYDLAINTSDLHNELGNFYQSAKRYADAIDQFKQVMAIDPWNREALFKLGQVYQYNGNWAQAQTLYKKVYNDDPFFNNVAHFYNQIEREYADRIDASASFMADTTRLVQTNTLAWGTNVNEMVGITAAYTSIYQRFPVSPGYGSLDHRFTLAVPLTPWNRDFSITPYAGGLLYNPLAGVGTSSSSLDGSTFFGSYKPRPLVGLGTQWTSKLFSAGLAYNLDTLEDTITKDSPLYSQNIQADGTLRFSFTGYPVFSDTSVRASAATQMVEDGALIYSVGGEYIIPLTVSNTPHLTVSFNFPVTYQDSQNVPPTTAYFAPRQALTTEASITATGDFDVSPGLAIHQALRGAVGYYGEQALDTSVPPQWVHTDNLTFALENRSEFSTEWYTAYVNILGTGKNEVAPQVSNLNYWSFTVEIGLRFRAPSLLVP